MVLTGMKSKRGTTERLSLNCWRNGIIMHSTDRWKLCNGGMDFWSSPLNARFTVRGRSGWVKKVLIQYRDAYGNLQVHDSIITKICWALNGRSDYHVLWVRHKVNVVYPPDV